jgi:hypothetical protein
MENTPLVDHYMGARPTQSPPSGEGFSPSLSTYGADIYAFPESRIFNPERFFLSARIGTGVGVSGQRPGPNLGILWHYGRLWREVDKNNRSPMVGLHPRVQSELNLENWLPYMSEYRGGNSSDQQHTNSGIIPIISHVQLGLRLRSVPATGPATGKYNLHLELKPVFGLWNPYNVGIQSRDYYLNTILPPMIQVGIIEPGGTERETTSWLRLVWPAKGGGSEPVSWWQVHMKNVDFEPGEVRMFSMSSSSTWKKSKISSVDLDSAWNETATLSGPLFEGNRWNSLTRIEVPAGSKVYFKDVYFQDSHHPDTQSKLMAPGGQFAFFEDRNSMSWMILKTTDGSGVYLSRMTGMWNSGPITQAAGPNDITVPARIIASASNRDEVLIEDLVDNSHHVGTWAFHIRTSDPMEVAREQNRLWLVCYEVGRVVF